MGSLTTAYLSPLKIASELKNNPNLIEDAFYSASQLVNNFSFENCTKLYWEKSFEDVLGILNQCGFDEITSILEYETVKIEHDDLYIRYLERDELILLNKLISNTSKDIILKEAKKQSEITNYYGDIISDEELNDYLIDYDKFVTLVNSANLDKKLTLLFTTTS